VVKDTRYKKFVYWLTEDEEHRLREEMGTRNIRVRSPRGVVCTPLDEFNKISSVSPSVWNETCSRQGSWYRNSEKKGQYLIVSAFELSGFEDKQEAIITLSEFDPPCFASIEDKKDMINDQKFSKEIPKEWINGNEREKKISLIWAKKLGSNIDDYDSLYLTHTANHANFFVNPRFFIKQGDEIIPYSIDRSAHLCSCCLELFQIIGHQYSKKFVAPCAGAVLFARLKPDQFLLVERP
jgi:hypothetical protein